jgi:pimeloyl-ACP methyl ester carboxylesterase
MEVFQIRSKLLSDFHARDVMLRAGVVFPRDYDPNRPYAAVYEVPGFGGNHLDGFRGRRPSGPAAELRRHAFFITLDPESPNGHTLFADSDVNGPCGAALVNELIPALEAKYKLIAQPSARIVRGHSSGGWSVLWLAVTYPETFGACWSSSPDPVDFRRFELVNIYDDASAYVDKDGNDVPSTRSDGKVTLSIRGENQQEEVLGENNSSAQQWDSWQAVYGSRAPSGWPAPLFDAQTGKLDPVEAEHYKRYDIGVLLRSNPDKLGPIFLQRVRLVCGDADDFYLNEAVALLKEDVERLKVESLPEGKHGYVKLLPGLDHGSVYGSEAMRAFPREMLEHLRRHGHAR